MPPRGLGCSITVQWLRLRLLLTGFLRWAVFSGLPWFPGLARRSLLLLGLAFLFYPWFLRVSLLLWLALVSWFLRLLSSAGLLSLLFLAGFLRRLLPSTGLLGLRSRLLASAAPGVFRLCAFVVPFDQVLHRFQARFQFAVLFLQVLDSVHQVTCFVEGKPGY